MTELCQNQLNSQIRNERINLPTSNIFALPDGYMVREIYFLFPPLWRNCVSRELDRLEKWRDEFSSPSALVTRLCQLGVEFPWKSERYFFSPLPLLWQFYFTRIIVSFGRVRGCLLKHNWITCRQDMRRWTLRWQRSEGSCRRRKAQTMRPQKRTRRARHKHRCETRSEWA